MDMKENYKIWMLSRIFYPLTQIILFSLAYSLELLGLLEFSIPALTSLGRVLVILVFIFLVSRLLYLKQPLWLVGLIVLLGLIMSFTDHFFVLMYKLTNSGSLMIFFLFYAELIFGILAFVVIIWSFFMRQKTSN